MILHDISTIIHGRGFTAKLCLLFILFTSSMGFAQSVQFSKDSIPVVNDEVVFSTRFNYELNKKEFHRRTYFYLNDKLNPYSGVFLTNNKDSTISRITDYLVIKSNFMTTYAMYITYNMHFTYEDEYCNMMIKDITYMEKGVFETQEQAEHKLDLPEHSGKDIMVDENYSWLFKKNASKDITEVTIERINEIIRDLDLIFAAKQKHN